MGDTQDRIARHLARNLQALRREHRLSQAALADQSGVPRSTLAHRESGGGNPGIQAVVAVARALRVGVDELLAAPRPDCLLLPAAQVPEQQRPGGVRVRELLPERVRGLEIQRLVLPPRSSMLGTPHVPGSKEYLHALSGRLRVVVSGERFTVAAGDVLAFPGDCGHSYGAPDGAAEAVSVVVPPLDGQATDRGVALGPAADG